MATAKIAAPTEQRVVLRDISWETYEGLLKDNPERSGPRLAYDQGMLEIMGPGPEHESINRTTARLVWTVALELGIELLDVGAMTYKRATARRGFEPDSSFYLRQMNKMGSARDIDPEVDPPPDLVIEIDISQSSMPKLSLFAGLGVTEVWRWEGDQMTFYQLRHGEYTPATHSRLIPPLTPRLVTHFVTSSEALSNADWHRTVVEWVRSL